jgi:hypothetical protein
MFFLIALSLTSSAFASETKYRTGLQYDGASPIEGSITYSPASGGSKIETVAVVSALSAENEIKSMLNQSWKSESELAETNLSTCVRNGGKLVNVTVRAGTFEACKTESKTADGEITKWTGNVSPNGLIRKVIKKKGLQTSEELANYAP